MIKSLMSSKLDARMYFAPAKHKSFTVPWTEGICYCPLTGVKIWNSLGNITASCLIRKVPQNAQPFSKLRWRVGS